MGKTHQIQKPWARLTRYLVIPCFILELLGIGTEQFLLGILAAAGPVAVFVVVAAAVFQVSLRVVGRVMSAFPASHSPFARRHAHGCGCARTGYAIRPVSVLELDPGSHRRDSSDSVWVGNLVSADALSGALDASCQMWQATICGGNGNDAVLYAHATHCYMRL